MLRKPQLKLNSYKIDTNTLQASLRQLSELKSQLETTVSYYKSHEDQLLLENERLKQQIAMLQNKTIEKPDHSICQTRILEIDNKLKSQRDEYETLKLQFEKQQKNNKLLIQQYESKLQSCIIEKQNMIDRYEQKITSLNHQLKQSKTQLSNKIKKQINNQGNSEMKPPQPKKNMEKQRNNTQTNNQLHNQFITSTNQPKQSKQENISNHSSSSAKDKLNHQSNIEQQSNNSAKQKLEHQSNIVNQSNTQSELKKSSKPQKRNPNLQHRKYHTSHEMYQNDLSGGGQPKNFCYFRTTSQLPNDEDEQVFQALIRKLFAQIKSLGITVKQTLVLPQLRKMINNQNPSEKDLFNFMKNPPISERNDTKIMQSLAFIQNTLKSKYGQITGKLMVETIIRKLQQYEQLSKINTQDLEISQMTPSEKSLKHSQRSEQKEDNNRVDYHKNIHSSRPSIQDYLN